MERELRIRLSSYTCRCWPLQFYLEFTLLSFVVWCTGLQCRPPLIWRFCRGNNPQSADISVSSTGHVVIDQIGWITHGFGGRGGGGFWLGLWVLPLISLENETSWSELVQNTVMNRNAWTVVHAFGLRQRKSWLLETSSKRLQIVWLVTLDHKKG